MNRTLQPTLAVLAETTGLRPCLPRESRHKAKKISLMISGPIDHHEHITPLAQTKTTFHKTSSVAKDEE